MTRLALVGLYNATLAVLAADAPAVVSFFGWRPPAQQGEALRRLVWTPGDPQGKIGLLVAPAQPGKSPDRPLATLGEMFTVLCHGIDRRDIESEIAQYIAARELFDTWYRAMYAAAFTIGTGGRVAVLDLTWVIDKKERPHGAALRALCTIQASIRELPDEIAPEPEGEFEGELAADLLVTTALDGEITFTTAPIQTETLTVTREEIEA